MPDNQQSELVELFAQAVDLLGGQRATADYLGVSDRTVRALLNPDGKNGRKLHDGFLRDTAAALVQHAEKCRKLEPYLFGFAIKSAKQGEKDLRRYDQQEGEANG